MGTNCVHLTEPGPVGEEEEEVGERFGFTTLYSVSAKTGQLKAPTSKVPFEGMWEMVAVLLLMGKSDTTKRSSSNLMEMYPKGKVM